MKCILLVSAQSVIIDKNTSQFSLINVYEQAGASIFPFPFPMYIFSFCEKEEGDNPFIEANVYLEMNGKTIFQHPLKIVFQPNNMSKISINLQGLIIHEPGKLKITLAPDKHPNSTYSISIVKN